MARPKSVQTEVEDVNSIATSLMSDLNEIGGGTKAYLQGDHAEHTCGITIPHIAFQWLVGGTTVLPIQRHLGISGLPKSFKSTLFYDIGNWYISQGGIHVALDNEGKTSASMLTAMTSYNPDLVKAAELRRVFKETKSVEEWQKHVIESIAKAKKIADRPKGSRIPILITIDSLNGKSSEATTTAIEKEGFAATRGFPIEAKQITGFFKGISLIGTTANIGFVQHLVQDISAAPGYNGPTMKESGAVIASYQGSAQIRVTKFGAIKVANHTGAIIEGPPVEGYTLRLMAERSCLGPDKNELLVDILWQYVEDAEGKQRQVMWYDWDGSLGRLLQYHKYGDKSMVAYEKEQLNKAIMFTNAKANRVNCDELSLEDATFTEFGKAIKNNPVVAARVSKYLKIQDYPTIQTADIELGSNEDA